MNNDPPPFRLRHFFIPQTLLDRGGGADNPLLGESARRRRRPWDKFLARFLEATLVFMAFLMLGSEAFSIESFYFDYAPIYNSLDDLFTFYLWWGPGALLLLRYQLFASGASQHLASLHRERMHELYLTRLNRDDYFLHHLLRLLQRHRAIYALAALACLLTFIGLSDGAYTFSALQVIHLFFLILLIWVASAWQYGIEWRLFAGARQRTLRQVYSWLISLGLAVAALFVVGQVYDYHRDHFDDIDFALPMILITIQALALLFLARGAHLFANHIRRNADVILQNRLNEIAMPCYAPPYLDWLFPWRTGLRLTSEERRATRPRQPVTILTWLFRGGFCILVCLVVQTGVWIAIYAHEGPSHWHRSLNERLEVGNYIITHLANHINNLNFIYLQALLCGALIHAAYAAQHFRASTGSQQNSLMRPALRAYGKRVTFLLALALGGIGAISCTLSVLAFDPRRWLPTPGLHSSFFLYSASTYLLSYLTLLSLWLVTFLLAVRLLGATARGRIRWWIALLATGLIWQHLMLNFRDLLPWGLMDSFNFIRAASVPRYLLAFIPLEIVYGALMLFLAVYVFRCAVRPDGLKFSASDSKSD